MNLNSKLKDKCYCYLLEELSQLTKALTPFQALCKHINKHNNSVSPLPSWDNERC